ncbi:MAG: hypothetical protein GF331_06715 [Chitinivibrionales bacterium]|nr:hypothetical protein [Chitinivibrionales bacterium]
MFGVQRKIIRMRTLCAALLIVLGARAASAFNHPEIKWKSVTTDHFIINYYDRTEPLLYATWRIAEEAYEKLAALYDYSYDRKISLSLADYDDYSNGWADWLSGSIMIWTPDARFELRGSPTWLRNVIAHELAHIMSLHQRKKMQTLDFTLSVYYSSPSSEVWIQEPFGRMTFLPEWLAEGAAQMGAERTGGDCWDSRRDMILRMAVMGGEQLTLAEMSHFSHNGLGSELVYNQGYSLASYMERTIGEEAFHQMFVSAGRTHFDFSQYFRLKTGSSLERMYHEWLDSVHAVAKARAPQNPTTVIPVWRKGFYNHLPRVSPDGKYWGWLTNHRDDGSRTDLVIAETGKSRTATRIEYAHTAWDFSSDGRSVYYVKSRRTDRHGSSYNDLYVRRIGSVREERLTRGARVYDIAASPDGKTLALTRYREGAYSLHLYDLATGSWTTVLDGTLGDPILTPCFNPANPDELAFTRSTGGNADVIVIDLTSRETRPLVSTKAQEEFPHWTKDGRVLFCADYGGIYNAYSVKGDGSDMRRLSRMAGGAFAPQPLTNGKILCVNYSSYGYGVSTFTPEDTPVKPVDTGVCVHERLPEPRGRVRVNGVPYKARMLRPMFELETFIDVAWDDTLTPGIRSRYGMAGLAMHYYRSDALMKKYLYMAMYLGLEGGVHYFADSADADTTLDTAASLPMSQACMRRGVYDAFDSALRDPRRGPESLLGPGRPTMSAAYRPRQQGPSGEGDMSADETDTISSPVWTPPSIFLQPLAYYENTRLRPTLGLAGTASLSMGMGSMMPTFFILMPFAEWHVMRDLYLGISPYGEVWPAYGFDYYVSASAWLQWLRAGYYEEDWIYTMRNITSLLVEVGPHLFPGENGAVAATVGAVSLVHGFPWGRSSSLVIEIDGSVTNGSDTFSSLLLDDDGASDLYAQGRVGTRVVIPIAKNINRGYTLYADALYGSAFYEGTIVANRSYIFNATRDDIRALLLKPETTPDAYLTHTVGAELTLGLFKDYVFFRTLSVKGSYELLYDKVFVDVGLTF